MLLLSLVTACGKKEEPAPLPEEPSPTPHVSKPTVIAVPPASTTPSPMPEATPTPFPQRTVYVAVAFQSVSDVGTHDFPQGAAVTLVGEEGDEYIVEYQGVSVRNHKSYFSDEVIEVAPAPTPSPTPETPVAPPAVEPPLPEATPDLPAQPSSAQSSTSEDQTTAAMLNKIKDLNDEIRVASDKLELDQDTASSATIRAEKARIEKLKKQKQRLSEDVTRMAKP